MLDPDLQSRETLVSSNLGSTFTKLNMYDLIKENDFEGFPMEVVRNYSIQILKALKYMKSLSVIHCDLKPENILMTDLS